MAKVPSAAAMIVSSSVRLMFFSRHGQFGAVCFSSITMFVSGSFVETVISLARGWYDVSSA
jgi:hypothetical protein